MLDLIEGPASACDSAQRACLDTADANAEGGDETATYANTTASPVDVFVLVGDYKPAGSSPDAGVATFSLDVQIP